MSSGDNNIGKSKDYLSYILKPQDLLPKALIVLISVTFAIIATYYSYIYILAIVLFVATGLVFLARPEWFLYFFAASRISLDAVKLLSYLSPEIGRRWSLSLDGIISGLLLFCAAIYFFTNRKIKIFTLPGVRPYLIFLVICFIGLFTSLDVIVGIRHFIHYLTYFLIYVLGVNILNTKEKNYKLAFAVLLSALIPLATGFYQALTISGILSITGFNRIYATVTYPNAYAFYLMIILIFVLTVYFYVKTFKNKLILLLATIPISLSLILTYTRGAWLGVSFGVGMFVLMLLRKLSFKNFILLIVFLFGISVLVAFFMPQIMERSSYLTRASMGSLGWRGMVWFTYFQEFLSHPFRGYGIGSCGVLAKKNLGVIIAPHNEYLKLMVETGIFGVIAFLSVMVLLLRFSIREYRNNPENKKVILASGLTAVIFGVLIVSFGDNLFDYDVVFNYFWFFVVMGYNLLKIT